MLFPTHIMLGIVSFFAFRNLFFGGNEVIFFLLVLLGSILPDIDEHNSKIARWSGFLSDFVSFFSKHRGIFHSFIFALFLSLLVKFLWGNYYAGALFIGYMAHLIGDAITPMGVKVFYPLMGLRLRGPIKTGSVGEGFVLVGLIVIVIKILLI